MFFVVSKLLSFVVQPLNWVIVCLLIGFFFRKTCLGKRTLAAGVTMIVFFTNPLAVNLITRAWEMDPVLMDAIEKPFDVAIVLSGLSLVVPEYSDRIHLNDKPNRLVNAIELYHAGKVRKILLSGGSSKVIGPKPTDAEPIRRFLLAVGIPSEDILMELQSRNTGENAVYSARLLASELPEARCLLVTSAFHMRRSLACFRKAGIDASPFATDLMGHPIEYWSPGDLLLPDVKGFAKWGILVREWVGIVAYKVKGYI